MPKNDPIWPEIGISIHFGPGFASSVGALSVGWLVVVARAVSRKTPIYFIFLIRILNYALVMVRHPVLEGLSSKNGGDRGLGYHGGRRQSRKQPDIFVFECSPKTLSVVWLLNILVQCCVVS